VPSRYLPLRSSALANVRLTAAAAVAVLVLVGCSGEIESTTNVTQTGATLNARFTCNQGTAGEYWLEYRRIGATGAWTETGRRTFDCVAAGSERRAYQVNGLSAGTSYEARLCGDLAGPTSPLCTDSNGKIHQVSDDSRTRRDLTYVTFTTESATSSSVTLRQVDGGLGYYGRFSNALPTDPSYFPIGVWGSYNHTQANRNLDADVGINLYVWAADSAFMDDIRADGRFRVIQDQGNRAGVGSETAGWLLADEIDMQQGPGACNGALQQIKNGLPADGRARYANYGKGIFPGWQTDAQFACFVEAQDLQSVDIYWFTDPNACTSVSEGPSLFGLNRALTQAECRRAANYGYVVDRMRALDARDGVRKPIWNFVEVSHPFSEAPPRSPTITGPQIRAAVWHSIIAGARGIIYFQHSFGVGQPCYGDHHTLRSDCHGNRAAVKATNEQVRSLAPVLNAPTVEGLVESSPGVRTMAKWQGGTFWVFAARSENGGSSSNTISLPCVGDATAAVDGESRSVPVTSGQLTDTFADGNTVHIYRIDGGSTCGLPAG
jgi:hypothetical protein